ncbi:MAG: hypothetical protein CR986_03480 [Ignavibacteriae bacterium]|nr:MAG: hypothetical protein CR986_03480 [Ignavibacteriota bacterium]
MDNLHTEKQINDNENKDEVKDLLILEEAKKFQAVFLDNMSHELRTPITVILGYAGILYEELEDPDLKEMAEIILNSSNRLTESLNLLLDQSNVDRNKLQVELVKVDLIDRIQENYELYRLALEEKNIQLETKILIEGEAIVNADIMMLKKVFNNLIGNAIKFTTTGKITLELKETVKDSKKYYQIDFIDTGIGIPPAKLKVIFEAFRQVSEGMNRLYQGTGLGLSVTKKFVGLMNGEITVESQIDKGSTFSVFLPAVN